MSVNKEKTISTQFSFSSDSISFEDSALISGLFGELSTSSMSLQKENSELISEIELINEDRQRLRKENENLKEKLEKSLIKTLQIELLSKVATKALEKTENFVAKEKLIIGNDSWSIKTCKGYNKSNKCLENSKRISPIVKRYMLSRTSSATSPLIILRNNSKITTLRTIINK